MQQKTGYLQSLKMVHMAMLVGQCLLLGIVFYMVMQHTMPPVAARIDKTLQVVALVVSFGGIAGANLLFKNRLAAINAGGKPVTEKAWQYRKANIRRWAITEAAETFCVICFYLVGNYAFAALAIALTGFFAMQGVNKIKIMLQLQLDEAEVAALQ